VEGEGVKVKGKGSNTSYVLPQCSLSVFKRSFINWCLFTL